MYNMIQKRKSEIAKNKKKGFTLVEVIVVLVILAILAAILIPSMIGWINKAQNKSAIVEARSVVLAAQTVASENYKDTDANLAKMASKATGTTGEYSGDLWALAELKAPAEITAITFSNHKVDTMTYKSTDGVTVTYAAATGFKTN